MKPAGKRLTIIANYAYFILVDGILRITCMILAIITLPIWGPLILLQDAFEKTYTEPVREGDINMWKRDKK